MSSDESVQWVSTAWITTMRNEALRVRTPEVARVITIGVWIATFADEDGSNAFPSRATIATLASCSQETVTRAVKVLIGVGVLQRKRRPNTSAMYQLLMPLGRKPDWAAHIHHMTETRQRKAYARKKAEGFQERNASTDAVRKASTDAVENPSAGPDSDDGRVPDSVRVGGSEPSPDNPDSVRGRPRNASVDAFRTASVDAPTKPTTTCGSDPRPDHNLARLSPQPPKRAGEAVKDESSTGGGAGAGAPRDAALAFVRARQPLDRCADPECRMPLPYGATGLCQGCTDYLATTNHERHSA
ncbi:helix-turn-helix domain-containing protein [Streptomyces sp. SLBN-134]|uniref:helix-turn-helix domain-containing protein n=1 Tax=Streptomyces sp. SLBN-134 TaxID=2768456 RepID=UPI00116BC842|nr:helix-turn-helix domain-containing protein [Streptomyces sp. SLBN-134]TQL21939.1 helix-turn-helix protein [Streptomyces sp. SLBN-134]